MIQLWNITGDAATMSETILNKFRIFVYFFILI